MTEWAIYKAKEYIAKKKPKGYIVKSRGHISLSYFYGESTWNYTFKIIFLIVLA